MTMRTTPPISGSAVADDLLSQVADQVRRAAKLPADRIMQPSSRLVEDLGIDSLDLVGVMLQVQDRFGVEIDDDDVVKLTTLEALTTYVAQRLPQV